MYLKITSSLVHSMTKESHNNSFESIKYVWVGNMDVKYISYNCISTRENSKISYKYEAYASKTKDTTNSIFEASKPNISTKENT